MLKVLYLPLGDQPGMVRAFQAIGADLTVFNFMAEHSAMGKAHVENKLVELVSKLQPDICHMQLQMTNSIDPAAILRAKEASPGTIFTNWSGDIRKSPDRYFVSTSRAVDFSLISNVGQIDLYKGAGGANICYWQIGYDPVRVKPLNKTNFKWKVAFAANAHQDNIFPDARLRKTIMQTLRERFGNDAGLFGGGHAANLRISSCSQQQVNDVYNNSLTVVSVSNFNDVSHYFSDRLLDCVGSGRPTIAYRFPGIDSYFADRGDILVANSVEEIVELVNYCASNVEYANKVGRNGSIKALAEHTFTSRVLELVSMVGLSGKL